MSNNIRLFKTAQFTDDPSNVGGLVATLDPPPLGYKWEGTVQVIGQWNLSGFPSVSPGNEDWHVFLADEAWGVFFATAVFGPITITGNEKLTVKTGNAVEPASYYSLVFIGNQAPDDGSEPYPSPLAIPTTVDIGGTVFVAPETTFPVSEAPPTATSILNGFLNRTATAVATTVLTIPAGRTWVGQVSISGQSSAGNTFATVSTAGAGVIPPAGTQMRLAWNASNNSLVQRMVVIAPAGNAVQIQFATTIPANGDISCSCIGEL